jgi:hypothetical protein
VAAAALLPVVAISATAAFADEQGAEKSARIDASDREVAFGDRVTLRGAFPGAANAPIDILRRAKGDAWERVEGSRTGASGRYRVRVKPRSSASWRAELAAEPTAPAPGEPAAPGEPVPAGAASVDGNTGDERIAVRSRTRATIGDRHALAGETVRVRGKVSPAGAKRRVVVEIGKAEEATRAGRDGRFQVAWKAPSTGTYRVDVRARSNELATASRDEPGKVTVYRPAAASWYGPGLYGNPMACGGTLSPSTMGVAHRSMPCGTKLRLRNGNRTVTVRVVDRGPFAAGREFDLTEATKRALGFGDVGTVLSSK